jgi:serine/threonine-protein kinase HipA
MVDVAEIHLWEQLVGAVRWDARQQLASFEYAPEFLEYQWDIAPITMPLNAGQRLYAFPELRARSNQANTFKGLPGLLADALPDRYGNQLINLWLARNGRPSNSLNPVEQLCFIGKRAMGALEFEPAQPPAQEAFDIELSSLVEAAHAILSKKEGLHTNLHADEEAALTEVLKVGTSAGGARPKAIIAYNPKTGAVKSGQTAVPQDFEHWLIKLDGVSDVQFGDTLGWGRVEYAYYLMALDCGLEMTECRLLEEQQRAHFMTKRFDRDGNTKHHVQTWCGLQHYDYTDLFGYSYEQLFETMRVLRLSYEDAHQMFRRMVFNVLASNCDDHTKNFAFRLKKDQQWELAPAYDVCYSYDPSNVWVNQHSLSINGKHKNITREDLLSIARANNLKKGTTIIEEISEVVAKWQDYAAMASVDAQLMERIGRQHVRLGEK